MIQTSLDRVGIVMMSAVGDAVHVLPLVNAIKRHQASSRITWVLQPGPASLMSHSHNEQLWNLQGFLVRGTLETDGGELVFRPARFVVTAGGGLGDLVRLLRGTRRAASDYLRWRNMHRPRVPWDKIEAAKQSARRSTRTTG